MLPFSFNREIFSLVKQGIFCSNVLQKWLTQMTTVTPVRPRQDLEGGTTEVEALSRAKGFLSLYDNLDQGMGSFFFLFMFTNQVAWIFYIFITISSLLGGKMDASSLSLSLSFGLGTLGLVLQVVSFTLALDRFGSQDSSPTLQ